FPDLGRRRGQRQPHRNHRHLALDAARRDLERSIRPLLPAAHDRRAARDNDLPWRGSVGSKHARRVPPLVLAPGPSAVARTRDHRSTTRNRTPASGSASASPLIEVEQVEPRAAAPASSGQRTMYRYGGAAAAP